MLLRASSEETGDEVDLGATVGRSEDGGGIEHGALLVAFAETVTRGSDDAAPARKSLLEAVGPEAFVVAAAIVAIFNGLVRVADSSGIPLDDGTREASTSFRGDLGLEEFGGAANTDLSAAATTASSERDVTKLFG